jgi:hypothetical protein
MDSQPTPALYWSLPAQPVKVPSSAVACTWSGASPSWALFRDQASGYNQVREPVTVCSFRAHLDDRLQAFAQSSEVLPHAFPELSQEKEVSDDEAPKIADHNSSDVFRLE